MDAKEVVHKHDVQCRQKNIKKMDKPFNGQYLGNVGQQVVADKSGRQEPPPQADHRKQFAFGRSWLGANGDPGQGEADQQRQYRRG